MIRRLGVRLHLATGLEALSALSSVLSLGACLCAFDFAGCGHSEVAAAVRTQDLVGPLGLAA